MSYHARCGICYARKKIKGNFDPNDSVKRHFFSCKGTMGYCKGRNEDPTKDRSAVLCYCDGLEMSMRNCPHNKGSIGCKYSDTPQFR